MNESTKRPRFTWKWRSLVSFFLLFSSLAMLLSGVVLFIAPMGRVAHSTAWRLAGLDKGQWEAVHTIFGYVGAIFGLVHLVLNWKVLLGYLKSRARHAYRLRAELLVALVLALIVGIGSVLSVPPFSTVMDWGESLKNSWESETTIPLTSEAETYPTPVFDNESKRAGVGWGRFTVAEICEQSGIPVTDGVAHLADYGIQAEAGSRIRELADGSGHPPSTVVEIIVGSHD